MEFLQTFSDEQSIGLNLMTLPSELHIQISKYLSYPDALALKHSSRHFYSIVNTGVRLKVDWLIERFEHKLECPMEKCSFSTDESFCNARVRGIMERRRWHLECHRVKGECLVNGGRTCPIDLLPAWFKMKQVQTRRQSARIVEGWGQDALLIGLIVVFLHILWQIGQRCWHPGNKERDMTLSL